MTEQERLLTRKLYQLTLQLYDRQGDEIQALKKANDALQKSHDTLGEMLQILGDLIAPA